MEDWRDPAQVKHVKLGREDGDRERERGKKESQNRCYWDSLEARQTRCILVFSRACAAAAAAASVCVLIKQGSCCYCCCSAAACGFRFIFIVGSLFLRGAVSRQPLQTSLMKVRNLLRPRPRGKRGDARRRPSERRSQSGARRAKKTKSGG